MSNWVIVIEKLSTHLPLQSGDNKQGIKQSTTVTVEVMIINFAKFVSADFKQKVFLIFCPILTNFLPKCRVKNVDSEKGHGAGKKGMALGKKGMARRHSKSG